jgi:hypothetical protein
LLALGVCFLNAAAAVAADPQIGTWKLNEAKSKISPGSPKSNTVVYEVAGDQVKVTVDGVDAKGQPLHHVWTGKFDGKDYAVTGNPMEDTRAYKKVNDHTMRSLLVARASCKLATRCNAGAAEQIQPGRTLVRQ